MAELGKTVKKVYDAMISAYQNCKDKKQGAKDALAIYEENWFHQPNQSCIDRDRRISCCFRGKPELDLSRRQQENSGERKGLYHIEACALRKEL